VRLGMQQMCVPATHRLHSCKKTPPPLIHESGSVPLMYDPDRSSEVRLGNASGAPQLAGSVPAGGGSGTSVHLLLMD